LLEVLTAHASMFQVLLLNAFVHEVLDLL